MKRVWSAAIISFLLILTCVLGIWGSTTAGSFLTDTISAAEEHARMQDWDSARIYTDKALQEWESYNTFGNMFISHRELEEIQKALTEMQGYLETQSFPQYLVACRNAKSFIEHVIQAERASLANIF